VLHTLPDDFKETPMPLTTVARDATALPFVATLALLATLLVSAGCSQGLNRKDLVQPTSPEGQACLQRCELPKSQCRQRQQARENECGQIYAVAKSEYVSCVKSGTAKCRAPYTCLGADLSICDQEYDACFADCGNQIERRLQVAAADNTSVKTGAGTESTATAETGEKPGGEARPAKMDPP
jgi:hypothetical protein